MKVLLVDDHPLVRAAFESILESMVPGVVVTMAHSAAEAQSRLAGDETFDLALIDLRLPDGDGVDLLNRCIQRRPALRAVIISASQDPDEAWGLLDRGAAGFIPKCMPTDQLTHALRIVLDGGVFVPPMVLQARSPAPSLRAWAPEARAADEGHGFSAKNPVFPIAAGSRLTPRQHEVLGLLMEGLSNKLIARRLNLSVETVKDHIAALLRALGVTSRMQAVLAVNPPSRSTAALRSAEVLHLGHGSRGHEPQR